MTPLRDYQARTIDACRAAYRDGKRSILIVSPTGSGKTRMGAEIARNVYTRRRRVRWIAHRRELIQQAAERLAAEGAIVGPLGGIEVESIQTLLSRDKSDPVDLTVLDEAHHYVAAEWGRIAHAAKGGLVVGLTATPERGDGTPLGDLFDHMVVAASIRELTELGHLVPCTVKGPPKRLGNSLAEDPVIAYEREARGTRAVVFCQSVAHAREVAESFTEAGFPAACVDGTMRTDDRDRALRAFRDGELRVLTNVFVLTEGWDCPETETCILARSVGSAAMLLQTIGRVLRPSPGKARALVLDLCGAVYEHGLPDADREYCLTGKAIRTGDTGKKLTRCVKCQAIVPAVDTCRECGGRVPKVKVRAPKPRLTPEQLLEISRVTPQEQKEAFLARKLAEARVRVTKSGKPFSKEWAYHQYRARFGHMPWEPVPAGDT